MIVCGWCASATEPGLCSHCGRDPALPWTQRNTEPPIASAEGEPAGRPKLDAGQIRAKLRIARKDNPDATNAMLADLLGISERTLGRWQKLSS